jgi:hypothetical protein
MRAVSMTQFTKCSLFLRPPAPRTEATRERLGFIDAIRVAVRQAVGNVVGRDAGDSILP